MASPSGTGHDTACPECGTPGGAYLTHVCYAGAVVSRPPPPADLPVAVPGPASAEGLNSYAVAVHAANAKWWEREDGTPIERNKGELLMLMVSEIAEAMEGERKGLMDDKLPHRLMAEVELADTLIRIFDYAAAFGYDLDGAYREKMAYNAQRVDHTYEARALAGGKKW